MSAYAYRQIRRTGTPRAVPGERRLDKPVFQRMKGKHCGAAGRMQQLRQLVQNLRKLVQLPVYGDPQGLKAAFCRVLLLGAAGRGPG